MSETPPRLHLRAIGDLACFSRPEFAVERTSYPWITLRPPAPCSRPCYGSRASAGRTARSA